MTLDDALRKLNNGDLRGGQRMLEELLRRDPNDATVLYNLGMIHSELGDYDKSIRMLEQALSLAPDREHVYAALGFSYSRKGQFEKAKEILERGLALDPHNFYILRNLGGVNGTLGYVDAGIEYLESANEIIPNTPEVLFGLASLYRTKGMTDTADLIFTKIINQDPDSEAAEQARQARTEIAAEVLHGVGPRFDAVMYCLSALEQFAQLDMNEVRQITMEIALLGRGGLDINDPETKYTLRSMPGTFSGLSLVSHMYVGLKMIDPGVDPGIDLAQEYQAALNLYRQRQEDEEA